jgi:hypothetical protein
MPQSILLVTRSMYATNAIDCKAAETMRFDKRKEDEASLPITEHAA